MTHICILRRAAIGMFALVLAACGGNYYQVTDPASGKSYYTKDIDHEHGHIKFMDKASGDEVNLESSEVREITAQQYKNAVGK